MILKQGFKSFLQNIAQAGAVNLVRLLISFAVTLVLPKFLGAEAYSYWQLYLFYASYAVYLSLGWNEGIYLRYGGEKMEKLDASLISSQFYMLAAWQAILNFAAIFFLVWHIVEDKRIVVMFAIVSASLEILRCYFQMLLQSVNEIGKYAKIAMLERILFFSFSAALLFAGIRTYNFFIYAEVVSRVISLFIAIWMCRRVLTNRIPPLRTAFKTTRALIGSGSKLSVASLASLFVVGIVRLAIEQHWGTLAFGRVSLVLSVVNMLLSCISAVGIVIFPMLRRVTAEKRPQLYPVMRLSLLLPSGALLLLYVPIVKILSLWLPAYADVFGFLAVLLPVCIYEGRSALLTDTWFKTYNRGGSILFVNILAVAVSLLTTWIFVFVIENLDLAIISIVALVAFKSILAECLLRRIAETNPLKDICWDMALVLAYITGNWIFHAEGAFAFLYPAVFVIYLFANRKTIVYAITFIRKTATKTE